MAYPRQISTVFMVILPVVMSTYYVHSQGNYNNGGDNSAVINFLIKEVENLKGVVRDQGERIQQLENRLAAQTKERGASGERKNQMSKENSHLPMFSKSSSHEVRGKHINGDGNTIEQTLREVRSTNQIHRRARGKRTVGLYGWSSLLIAFSVQLDHDKTDLAQGQILKYTSILHNGGGAYEPLTGVFTAPFTDTYFFVFHIEGYRGEIGVSLVVDGVAKSSARINSSEQTSESASNSAILGLNYAQKVWIEVSSYTSGCLEGGIKNTFSGYRFYSCCNQ